MTFIRQSVRIKPAYITFGGLFLLAIFSFFKKSNNGGSIVGEKCIVVERIDNQAGCGEVKVRGQIWSARGVNDDDFFDEGEALKIVAVEGAKLICKK